MPTVIRISLNAHMLLDHGSEISRLSTLAYVSVGEELTEETVEDISQRLEEKLAEWMEAASQLEKDHQTLYPKKKSQTFKLPVRRIPPNKASRPRQMIKLKK